MHFLKNLQEELPTFPALSSFSLPPPSRAGSAVLIPADDEQEPEEALLNPAVAFCKEAENGLHGRASGGKRAASISSLSFPSAKRRCLLTKVTKVDSRSGLPFKITLIWFIAENSLDGLKNTARRISQASFVQNGLRGFMNLRVQTFLGFFHL